MTRQASPTISTAAAIRVKVVELSKTNSLRSRPSVPRMIRIKPAPLIRSFIIKDYSIITPAVGRFAGDNFEKNSFRKSEVFKIFNFEAEFFVGAGF